MKKLGLGLGMGVRAELGYAANLLNGATYLNDFAQTFTRASVANDPYAGSAVISGARRRRPVSVGLYTFNLDLIEGARTNKATTLATGTYTATATATHTVWWDGGLNDYTITASVGTPGANTALSDGRNVCIVTGVTNTSTITCTRAGSPTNTHLQVEQGPFASSKITITGSAATRAADLLTSTIAISQVAGTVLLFAIPYGWTGDQDGSTNFAVLRDSSNNAIVCNRRNATQCQFFRNDSGGTQGSNVLTHGLTNGTLTQLAMTYQATSVPGYVNGVISSNDTSLTGDFTATTTLCIGSQTASGVPFFGWVGAFYLPRVLTASELLAIRIATP